MPSSMNTLYQRHRIDISEKNREKKMTLDDKKKCSEIWQMISDDYIEPRNWNENAGNELARFLASAYNCSNAMSFVPSPSGSTPGWGWIAKYIYDVFKNKYNMNKSLIFSSCLPVSISRFRSTIPAACFY